MRTKYNVDKMYTYLRGFLVGAQREESIKALQFARAKHKDQTRKDGTPYIVHPLRMACYAVAIGIRDDNIIATVLLHDVVEDCGVDVDSLPVNGRIRAGVKYMTVRPYEGEDKATTKQRYFRELLESREALVTKALDRYDNLSDMAGVLSQEAIMKNVKETNEKLLPVLKEAKEKWTDLSDILFVLRTNIRNINDTLSELVPALSKENHDSDSFECETESCAFNNNGICKYSGVYGCDPVMTSKDGCISGTYYAEQNSVEKV